MKSGFRNAAMLLIVLAGLTPAHAQPSTPHATPPYASSPLGTNLWFFRDWVSGYAVVDAFKASRPWLTQCMDCTPTVWDSGEAAGLDLDENGWVRSLPAPADPPTYTSVGTLMLSGFGGHYPAGQYIVRYEGEGTLAYGYDAIKNVGLSAPGRDVLDVASPTLGIWLRITATDPNHTGNYIRNIRVLMPGLESVAETQIFHPNFVANLAPYRALRFMQWMETNGSAQSQWSTRTHLTQARWNTSGGAGVPIEAMLALANQTSSDPWFNMPHQANDDYMTQFATLVRDTLAPNLKVYVEYSNEVWNGSPGYSQSAWVQQQGLARWPSAAPFTAQMNWHGMRTAQMCDIWEAVWGAQSGRVVCVMGAQGGNPWTASQALDCPLWTEGAPCTAHGIDALAPGPYFAGYIGNVTLGTTNVQNQVLAWTTDPDGGLGKLFDEIQFGGVLTNTQTGAALVPGGALTRTFEEMSQHAAIAQARGVALVAYEGGSHFASVGNNAAVTNLFIAASRDPRLETVYDQYLAGWRARGGQMFMHYFNVGQFNQLGAFGALEYLDQSTSPKQEALLNYINANPCWWAGCALTELLSVFLPVVTR